MKRTWFRQWVGATRGWWLELSSVLRSLMIGMGGALYAGALLWVALQPPSDKEDLEVLALLCSVIGGFLLAEALIQRFDGPVRGLAVSIAVVGASIALASRFTDLDDPSPLAVLISATVVGTATYLIGERTGRVSESATVQLAAGAGATLICLGFLFQARAILYGVPG
jgi:hypothetical protein